MVLNFHHNYQTIRDWNYDLDLLIASLIEAHVACKDAQEMRHSLFQAGEILGEFITLPGSGRGLASLFPDMDQHRDDNWATPTDWRKLPAPRTGG